MADFTEGIDIMSKETTDLPQEEGVILNEDAEPPSSGQCNDVLRFHFYARVIRLGRKFASCLGTLSQEEIAAFYSNSGRKRFGILRS